MQSSISCDRELIRRYLVGDDRSFEQLLARHKDRIYSAILMFVKDETVAEDLFQETFIKIIDTLRGGKYNDEGKFIHWAMRIAHNLCVDHFRRCRRLPTIAPTESFDVFNVFHLSEESFEQGMIRNQTFESVRTLIDQLPPEQREVVILRHYSDLSFKEIADMTQVSINTALGRMRYALINIRKMMTEKQIYLQ
jgi:RNA polymerase sigma-70 factor (ECF subfamily)